MSKSGPFRFPRLAGYAITVGILLVVLCLILLLRPKRQPTETRGEVPKAESTASAPQPETPTPQAASASAADEERALAFIDDAIGELVGPPKLSDVRASWVRQAESEIDQIAAETFQETLDMMVDYTSNYARIILADNASRRPATPSSLRRILYCRRFAKLLEETQSGVSAQQASAIARRLRADLAKWRELTDAGQDLLAPSKIFSHRLIDSSDLIVPLTFRINATILLAGERCVQEALSLVIEACDTMGTHTNWSAAGYACDKIIRSMDRASLDPGQQAVLDEYPSKRATLAEQGWIPAEYEVIELPSFTSSRRPFERATVTGAEIDFSQGKVSVEMPLIYEVWVTFDPDNMDPMSGQRYEYRGRTVSICKLMVETAGKLLSDSN